MVDALEFHHKEKSKMSRYAKPGMTEADLKRMIEDNGGVKEIVYNDKVHKDLLKIDLGVDVVDFIPESAIGNKFQMVKSAGGDYPIAWCYANAEGEEPIMFVVYIGQEGKLRAYIPDSGNNICNAHTRHKDTFEGTVYGGKWDWRKCYFFDPERMMECVKNRIVVKGGMCAKVADGSGKREEAPLTYRQLIQSLKDFGDQYAAVCPVAKGAEDPVWGIQYIWFEDGILNLGQYDDEGLTCDLIAERIEKCVPVEILDEVAVVRIGVAEDVDGGKKELYDPYGLVSVSHKVKSSVVKACPDDDWFCKWILKFA